jgi:lysophospholipase L1-like esterase
MTFKADFQWHVIPQAGRWINAWDAAQARYDPSYAEPDRPLTVPVFLDASKSSGGGQPITGISWHIQGLDGVKFDRVINVKKSPSVSVSTPTNKLSDAKIDQIIKDTLAKFTVTPTHVEALPRAGRYKVSLTVTKKDGIKKTTARDIAVRHLRVVSIGDSAASGEGNPDVGQDVDAQALPPHISIASAQWTDRRCHRSRFSGHALAAAGLEDSSTAVTFLSFACSGADIETGLLGPYEGQQPPPGHPADLIAQLEAIDQAVGPKGFIDYLFITVGVNDLGFSGLIKALAVPDDAKGNVPGLDFPSSSRAEFEVDLKLGRLPGRYNELAFALSRRFSGRVGQVYITEYPADIFSNDAGQCGGCDALGNIDSDEAKFVFDRGQQLNGIIRAAAATHGWVYVPGILDGFRGHGYCSSQPFYVSLMDSAESEGSLDGTVHPNHRGHQLIAKKLEQAVRANPVPQRNPQQVTVTFESVRVVDQAKVPTSGGVRVRLVANDRFKITDPLPINREIALDPNAFRLDCGVLGNGLAGILAVTAETTLVPLEPLLEGKRPPDKVIVNDPTGEHDQPKERKVKAGGAFDAKVGFGGGTHTSRGQVDKGSLEIRYRIDVKPVRNFGEIGEVMQLAAEKIASASKLEPGQLGVFKGK